jgi:hypothetical protein
MLSGAGHVFPDHFFLSSLFVVERDEVRYSLDQNIATHSQLT